MSYDMMSKNLQIQFVVIMKTLLLLQDMKEQTRSRGRGRARIVDPPLSTTRPSRGFGHGKAAGDVSRVSIRWLVGCKFSLFKYVKEMAVVCCYHVLPIESSKFGL